MGLWVFVRRNGDDNDTLLNCDDSAVLLEIYLFNT
jgi:hypothetical protein